MYRPVVLMGKNEKLKQKIILELYLAKGLYYAILG